MKAKTKTRHKINKKQTRIMAKTRILAEAYKNHGVNMKKAENEQGIQESRLKQEQGIK